jgi:hypothetical protein
VNFTTKATGAPEELDGGTRPARVGHDRRSLRRGRVVHAELQVLPDRTTLVLAEVVADQVDEPDLAVLGDSRLDGGAITSLQSSLSMSPTASSPRTPSGMSLKIRIMRASIGLRPALGQAIAAAIGRDRRR